MFIVPHSSRLPVDCKPRRHWRGQTLERRAAPQHTCSFSKSSRSILKTDLRYNWPKYLPAKKVTTAKFFSITAKTMFAETAAQPVFWSLDGTKEQPEGLRILLNEFRVGTDLQPFFATPTYCRRYLAASYDVTAPGLQSKLSYSASYSLPFKIHFRA